MARVECISCGTFVQVDFMAKLMRRVVCQVCNKEMKIVFRNPLILDFPDEVADEKYSHLDYSNEDYDHL